jgi:hypothetical protein
MENFYKTLNNEQLSFINERAETIERLGDFQVRALAVIYALRGDTEAESKKLVNDCLSHYKNGKHLKLKNGSRQPDATGSKIKKVAVGIVNDYREKLINYAAEIFNDFSEVLVIEKLADGVADFITREFRTLDNLEAAYGCGNKREVKKAQATEKQAEKQSKEQEVKASQLADTAESEKEAVLRAIAALQHALNQPSNIEAHTAWLKLAAILQSEAVQARMEQAAITVAEISQAA